jgi:hypothetical protein
MIHCTLHDNDYIYNNEGLSYTKRVIEIYSNILEERLKNKMLC